MAETTHTGLDALAGMDLQELVWWAGEQRAYLEAKAAAIREASEA